MAGDYRPPALTSLRLSSEASPRWPRSRASPGYTQGRRKNGKCKWDPDSRQGAEPEGRTGAQVRRNLSLLGRNAAAREQLSHDGRLPSTSPRPHPPSTFTFVDTQQGMEARQGVLEGAGSTLLGIYIYIYIFF